MNLYYLKMVKDGIRAGEIPEWLIMEFLIRLPPKIVFRLKLVSKQWLSVILDPYFVNLYCSRALKRLDLEQWIFISAIGVYTFKLLEDICSERRNLHTLDLPCFGDRQGKKKKEKYMIHDVRNGFVLYGLLYSERKDVDYTARICNPVTGQWISIPPYGSSYQDRISCSDKFANWGFMTNIEGGVLISYTVVRLYASMDCKSLTSEVFLSEVGEWSKYILIIGRDLDTIYYTSCSIVNGVMHWGTHENHELIAYDPRKDPDRVRFIALPGEQREDSFSICHAHKEQLRYFEVSTLTGDRNTFQGYNIWVLNDISSGDWCLEHRVIRVDIQISNAPHIGRYLSRILPVSFHPYDSDIVYLRYGNTIFLYNGKTRNLEAPEDFCHSEDYMQLMKGIYVDRSKSYLFQIPPWPMCFSRSLLERQMCR